MNVHQQEHPFELLPWLVNDTLEGAERERVQQHVESCATCREQVVFLRALAGTVDQLPQQEGGSFGLQRLLHSVRAERPRLPRWLVPSAVAAGIVLVVQSVMLVQIGQEDRYTLLSGSEGAENSFLVEFAPDATAEAIRALLREYGVRIVDGPSAAGLYRIELETDAVSHREVPAVLKALQARKQIIVHLQRE